MDLHFVVLFGDDLMTEKRLLRIFKPILLINAFKIMTGKKKMSEQSIRTAYALEYGTDAMEYRRDDFYD